MSSHTELLYEVAGTICHRCKCGAYPVLSRAGEWWHMRGETALGDAPCSAGKIHTFIGMNSDRLEDMELEADAGYLGDIVDAVEDELARAGFPTDDEHDAEDQIRAMRSRIQQAESALAQSRAELERLRKHSDLHTELSERLKVALNMPGNGNYVDFAAECRAAWAALAEIKSSGGTLSRISRVMEERDQARAELERVRKERDALRGVVNTSYGYLPIVGDMAFDGQNLTPHVVAVADEFTVRTKQLEASQARIAQLEAVVREKLREAVNIGFMNNTAFLSGEDGVDVEKWINYTIAAALGGNGEVG